ncbi:hypothetical protein AB8810_23155 [Xanthomonas sp. NCPPB 3005]|uniref:hypothetical protein n=1 Tax=Xanthomonas sp. NCPPB 3005 TaxID=3240913 RepID=UPI0035191851
MEFFFRSAEAKPAVLPFSPNLSIATALRASRRTIRSRTPPDSPGLSRLPALPPWRIVPAGRCCAAPVHCAAANRVVGDARAIPVPVQSLVSGDDFVVHRDL